MKLSLNYSGWIVWALRVIIAAIFLYAGIAKTVAPLRFVTDVNNFHLLPWRAGALLAFYLPWLEIGCGLALLLRLLERGAALILLCLTLVFVIALVGARIRGIDVSCGCFGHTGHDLSLASHLILNLAIVAGLLTLWSALPDRARDLP
jgi:putative oxidoreductase